MAPPLSSYMYHLVETNIRRFAEFAISPKTRRIELNRVRRLFEYAPKFSPNIYA